MGLLTTLRVVIIARRASRRGRYIEKALHVGTIDNYGGISSRFDMRPRQNAVESYFVNELVS